MQAPLDANGAFDCVGSGRLALRLGVMIVTGPKNEPLLDPNHRAPRRATTKFKRRGEPALREKINVRELTANQRFHVAKYFAEIGWGSAHASEKVAGLQLGYGLGCNPECLAKTSQTVNVW